jgi:hypothetical protein
MPIVVDEVVISVEVEDRPAGDARSPGLPSPAFTLEDKQALVAECVERVLEVLAQREER